MVALRAPNHAFERQEFLRVVRCLPPDAGVGQRADLIGQASDNGHMLTLTNVR